jgi:signal transduction histidine kinase
MSADIPPEGAEALRLLMLEDSPLDAGLITEALGAGGLRCAVCRVETREAFVAALEEGEPDLVLSDYALPGFDGLSALELTRAKYPEVPFVVVSGVLGEEVAIEALKRGATDYVLKQRLGRLVPTVRRALAEARERAERRRAEAALARGNERLRLAAEAARLGTWQWGVESGVIDCDARCQANLGRPAAGPLTPEALFEAVHPDDRGRVREEVARALERGAEWATECRVVWPDGSTHWVLVRGLPAGTGPARQMFGVSLDITERKRSEELLREQDRRKDEFLAMLAHELRNPLAPIRNAVAIINLSPDRATRDQAREMIERQMNHLVRLVDDLLDVSRITRGKIELRREAVDVADVLRSAVETARPLIDAGGHELAVELPEGPLRLRADPVRLAQVFGNLLNNAAKFTDRGHITVSARREGGDAVVRVRDDGVGIPAELLPHIFEPFTQADRSLERSGGGLGIGLALARRLVEMHGGTIGAASGGAGRGTEVTVRLPALAEGPGAERAPSRPVSSII